MHRSNRTAGILPGGAIGGGEGGGEWESVGHKTEKEVRRLSVKFML